MNKSVSSLILLIVLAVTNAYLLSHPNLVGKIGILVYRHDYIRTFPRAMATVGLVLLLAIIIGEVLQRWATKPTMRAILGGLMLLTLLLFGYIYQSFSSFSYKMTGKSFIYGAHLLPILVMGIFLRYSLKSWMQSGTEGR